MRQHMIACKDDPGGGIVVDEVTAGVARRVNRAEGPRPQVEVGPVRHPAVGILPVDEGGRLPVQVGQPGCQV